MIDDIKDGIIRMNQVILTFPVWLVLGLSGLFHRDRRETGWSGPEDDGDPEKLY